jgi:tetratricopeptide (TPR) repeat protein
MRQALITIIAVIVAHAASDSATAQALVLKDNSRLGPDQFSVEDGKVLKKVRVGQNIATSTMQMSTIARMEWPVPEELTASRDLRAAGKTKEALELLAKGRAFFEPFKDVPGNHYADLSLAYLETMSQGEDFTATLKALAEAQRLKLTDAQKLNLKIIKLNVDRQASSDYVGIIAQAENILAESIDSAVGASVWMIIGDVYTKQKDYEKALMAYLRVPVFYGTQVQKVPEAELQAARSLALMRRFEDAQAFYSRLEESYKGSGVAATAAQEKTRISGLKNDEGGTDEPPAEEPAKDAAPAAEAAAAQ